MSIVAGERDGRLIVMGGTTEPGVFQVEHKSTGDILHVTQHGATGFIRKGRTHKCKSGEQWKLTKEANQLALEIRGIRAPNNGGWVTCPCVARRLD